jgi:hypothetical protein
LVGVIAAAVALVLVRQLLHLRDVGGVIQSANGFDYLEKIDKVVIVIIKICCEF